METESTNYTNEITAATTPEAAFKALTTGIGSWWVEPEGAAAAVGDTPVFRFGETYWKMRIVEIEQNQKVVWECVEANHVDSSLPDGTDPQEWKGTRLVWEVQSAADNKTSVRLTHEGLVPQLQCYNVCTTNGWDYFLVSLQQFLQTGNGTPFVPE